MLGNYLENEKELAALKRDCYERLKSKPHPLCSHLLSKLSRKLRLPSVVVVIAVCVMPFFIGLSLALFFNENMASYSDFWIRVNFSGYIAGALFFMPFIYSKFYDFLSEWIYMIDDKKELEEFERLVDYIFRNRWQEITCIFTCIVGTATGVYFGVPLEIVTKSWIIAVAAFANFLIGYGLWFTILLPFFIKNFLAMNSLRVNYMEPSVSVGIRELANISSTWALCFMFEAIFVCIGLFVPHWAIARSTVLTVSMSWTLIILFLTVMNSIYPQIIISNKIIRYKRNGSIIFQEKVNDVLHRFLYADRIKEFSVEQVKNELETIRYLHEVYKNIIKSKNYAIDLTFVSKLASAILIPIGLLFLQKPDIIYSLVRVVRNIFYG